MSLGLLAAVLRIVLASVFVVSAAAKLADRDGTRRALVDFRVPSPFLGSAVLILPAAEAIAALLLLPAASAVVGGALAASLLTAFSVAVGLSLARGEAVECRCFGALSRDPVSRRTLARNALLLAGAIAVPLLGPGPSLVAWVDPLTGAERIALGIAALSLVVASGSAATVALLWRQHARLMQGGMPAYPLAPIEPRGLPVGSVAPAFELERASGGRAGLDGLLGTGRGVVLVFVDVDCGACTAALPAIGRAQRGGAEVAVVSRGSVERNLLLAEEHRLENLLLQQDHEVMDAYQAKGTPSAVLVGSDGLVRSPLAEGADSVASLLEAVTHLTPRGEHRAQPLDWLPEAAGTYSERAGVGS